MQYIIIVEQLMFWGGLLIFLISLAMYAGRTKDFKSIILFWQPTIAFNEKEFKINRTGMTMMILGVVIRIGANFI